MVLTQTVNGQTTSFEYDNMGRQTKVTAPGNVVTNTAYYLTGEIRRIDGAAYPVEYTYNNLGNQATMTTFKDADTPQQTSWSYNSRGRMIAKTYADNSSVTYTYNGDGQLLTRTWARQANGTPLVTSYTYDAAGRQTGYSYSDGTTPAVTQTLNFLDQPVTVTDAAGTRNFTYNADHRLVNETIPSIVNGMIDYTYDAYGRRTVMSFGNGTTSFANAAYSYDSAGRIATVGNSADTLTYTYMPGTNIIGSSVWQNATLNTVNTYDSYKRLTNIAVNGVNVYGYTLNDKNQRTGATLPDGNTWSYDYDAMGQLTGAVKQSSGNTQLAGMSWFYDQIGNRTSATENNVTTSYISNLVNQYTQIASQLPTYDADGNMLTYNGWTFTWNGENRLIAAESSDTRLEFSYDYMGRRLEKKVYTKGLFTLYDWSLVKHHKFVYDGYKLIAEFDVLDADAQPVSYLWQPVGLDVPLMRNSEYYIVDGNKNVIELRNAAGAVTASYAYNPFGAQKSPTAEDENPFRFSSEYHDDETDLVYYNYRYYSPELGRWINRDPIEEEGGVNLYTFVDNRPTILYDYVGFTPKGSIFFPNYPDYQRFPTSNSVWDYIGGTVKKLLSGNNSCAARISVALILSKEPIPKNKRQFYNTLKRSETGISGNYITSAKRMASYLSSAWGTSSKCSKTKAMYFSSNAKNIKDIRSEILQKLAQKEKGCECRKNFVAVVFSAAPAGSGGLSGHIGVVTESYNDGSTPFSQPSQIWILPDEKK